MILFSKFEKNSNMKNKEIPNSLRGSLSCLEFLGSTKNAIEYDMQWWSNVTHQIIIAYHIYCILVDPRNSKQLKDPRRELGISLFSYLSLLKFWKEDRLILIIFSSNIFYENKREGIKWISQNKEILEI